MEQRPKFKLMIRKFSLWERVILLFRGQHVLARRGWMLYTSQPGFVIQDPVHPRKIVGQILYSGRLEVK